MVSQKRKNDAIHSANAWPFWGFDTEICFSLQYGCLIVQLRFPVSIPSRSSRRLSTVKKPFDSNSVSTIFPVWLQLMLAAGFPPSALHTATIFLSLGSNQADTLGGTDPRRTKRDKLNLLNTWAYLEFIST